MLRYVPCLLVGTMLCAPQLRAQDGPFVAGGVGKTATIIPGPGLAREDAAAARDLARYLEMITGSTVPVATSADGVTGLKIHVGPSPFVEQQGLDLQGLFRDGYVIRLVDPDNLVIAGGEHLGTGFGVYDFLKRVCGVRWFMPGPLGEVVPRRERVVLDGLDLRSEPSVQSAWLRPIAIDNLKAKHFRRYHWAGHNLSRLIPPEEYGAEHPEYYPLVNGVRRVPLGQRFPWQPCVTNPQLPQLVVGVAREHFAQNPYSEVFSLGVNDGGGDCLCDRCTALDRIHDGARDMSDRYVRFYNTCAERFAEQFPDKLLGFHAYGGVSDPPTRERLAANTYVRLTGGPDVLGRLAAWSRVAPHLGVYDYLYGTQILEPRHYPRVLGEHLKTLVQRYHILSYEAEVYPFWPLDGPKCWVLTELLWDADQDVDALLAEYYDGLYVEASAPMTAFFDRLEEVYRRHSDPTNFFQGFRRGGFEGWTVTDLQYLDQCIVEAEAAAQDDTVRARVQMVADAWRHVRCWLSIYVYTGELAALEVRDQSDADRVVEIARAIYGAMAEKAQWDQRVLDPTLYPSEDYYEFYVARHYAEPGPLVPTIPKAEDAIEAACERITASPLADRDSFWAGVISAEDGDSPLAAFARTQRYRLAHELRDPLVVLEDNFEGEGQTQPEMPADVAEANRWERRANLPAGYGVWSYTGRPARFVWTDRIAHSGTRCIGIEENEVQASIMRTFPVEVGQRYRVRVFATRLREPAGQARELRPQLTIAWQGASGWTTDPRLSIEAAPARSGEWVECELRIAVPPAATSMVVMMGIDGSQLGGGGAYFDDLCVTRIDAEAVEDALPDAARQ